MQFTKKELPNVIVDYMVEKNISVAKMSQHLSINKDKLLGILFDNKEISDEDFKNICLYLTVGSENYQKIKNKDEVTAKMIVVNSSLSVSTILGLLYSLGITGLSGAGITTALALLGGLIGGGMTSGILLLGAIPLVIYGLTRNFLKD